MGLPSGDVCGMFCSQTQYADGRPDNTGRPSTQYCYQGVAQPPWIMLMDSMTCARISSEMGAEPAASAATCWPSGEAT